MAKPLQIENTKMYRSMLWTQAPTPGSLRSFSLTMVSKSVSNSHFRVNCGGVSTKLLLLGSCTTADYSRTVKPSDSQGWQERRWGRDLNQTCRWLVTNRLAHFSWQLNFLASKNKLPAARVWTRHHMSQTHDCPLTLLSMSSLSFFCDMLFWILLLKEAFPADRPQRSPSSIKQQLCP